MDNLEELYEKLYGAADNASSREEASKGLYAETMTFISGREIGTAEKMYQLGEAIEDTNQALYLLQDVATLAGEKRTQIMDLRNFILSGNILGAESEFQALKGTETPESEDFFRYAKNRFDMLKTSLREAEKNLSIYSKDELEQISEALPAIKPDGTINVSTNNVDIFLDKNKIGMEFAAAIVSPTVSEEPLQDVTLFENAEQDQKQTAGRGL